MPAATSRSLAERLADAAVMETRPDGAGVPGLGLDAAARIGERFSLSGAAVAAAALERGIVPVQYLRNQKTLGTADQVVLARSGVAVAGLGGLGGHVAEMLARMGVGRLTLIDADRFEPTNLNRQVLCTLEELGGCKAEVAARRVAAVNPAVAATARVGRIDAESAVPWLAGHQVVVDCLDNLPDRFLLESACRENGTPLVSGAVAGYCGQLTVIFPNDTGLAAVYGDAGTAGPTRGVEAELGNLACTVGVLAGMQCAQVLALLLTGRSALRRRLLVMDLSAAAFEVIRL